MSLKLGKAEVNLLRSDSQIAIKPDIGMSESMEFEIQSMSRRVPVGRRGRLGAFEIIDIQAPTDVLLNERAVLREAPSIRQEVPVYHTSNDRVPFVPEGTIYLSFKEGTSKADKEDLFENFDLGLVAAEPNGFLTIRIARPGLDPVTAAARLQDEDRVSVAEPDLITPRKMRNFLPDDALLGRQWHLENTGSNNGQEAGYKKGADARVVSAWKVLGNLGNSDVVVGIIDDGFDLTHPDLAENHINPWDFIRGSDNVQPEPNLNFPQSGDWHGTACAGVAVGRAAGGQIVGAAPLATLLPVRMTDHLSPSQVVRWFDHMKDKGAWIVSCSWGAEAKVYPLPDRISNAIEGCAREGRGGKGCVIVFAAGNSGEDVNDPPNSQNGFAAHPDVVAVAASTSLDRRASYSQTGKEIWVCAPSAGRGGWGIITSDVTGTYVDASGTERSSGYGAGDYFLEFEGTSSACPLVAGVCALVLGANPELTAADVREILKRTARKIGPESDYQDGHSRKFGHGCVNAEAAVTAAIEVRDSSEALIALRESETSPHPT